jgi:hypothetical protein
VLFRLTRDGAQRTIDKEAVMGKHKWALVFIMVLLSVAIAHAANTTTKKAGDYTVAISMGKNPPTTGKNDMGITISDQAGKAVTDAKVVVEYAMPAMSGMPAMSYKSNGELKGQTYRAVIEPSMAGSWGVTVRITRGGKAETVRHTIDVK